MVATARIPLKGWDSPAQFTLIQGCKYNELLKNFVVSQADDVRGQKIQDHWFHTHDKQMNYTGVATEIDQMGHGSSWGMFNEKGKANIIVGHAILGPVMFELKDGLQKNFRRLPKIAVKGDIACSQKHDLLCVRNGDTYVGYTLSSVLKGDPHQLFRTVIKSDWYDRFQGHHITKINGKVTLMIHGDYGTKEHSEARFYTITSADKWRTLDKIDTTGMGDEAEGFTDYNGRIWIVKRTGGNNGQRVVCLTPTKHLTSAVGNYVVAHTAKGHMWARKKGQPNVKRNDGFRVTTGVSIEWLTFPDVPGREQYVVTEKEWAYRLKALARI